MNRSQLIRETLRLRREFPDIARLQKLLANIELGDKSDAFDAIVRCWVDDFLVLRERNSKANERMFEADLRVAYLRFVLDSLQQELGFSINTPDSGSLESAAKDTFRGDVSGNTKWSRELLSKICDIPAACREEFRSIVLDAIIDYQRNIAWVEAIEKKATKRIEDLESQIECYTRHCELYGISPETFSEMPQ